MTVSERGENMEELLCTAVVTDFPVCPLGSCHREMQPETTPYHAGEISTTGLRRFRCPTCGHIGMVAASGFQLVFRLVQRYVLTYDPYRSTITVVLPAPLILMGQTYGLNAEAMAKHAAEWTLLSGNSSGTLTLVPQRQDFLDFTDYLNSIVLPKLSDSPRPLHG